MVLVDSSVWIDHFNGTQTPAADRLDAILDLEPIAVGDIILIEVLQGFRNDRDYRTAKSLLTSLTMVEMLGQKLAIRSADNFRRLRSAGVTVRKTIDVAIATSCIETKLSLLYSDRDFDSFCEHLWLRDALRDYGLSFIQEFISQAWSLFFIPTRGLFEISPRSRTDPNRPRHRFLRILASTALAGSPNSPSASNSSSLLSSSSR